MLPGIFKTREKNDKVPIVSALNCMIYFGIMFIVVICSFFIPRFGLTEEFLEATNYSDTMSIGGILTEMPETTMCFGVLYYLSLTLMEVMMIKKKW